ncbi:hypothetical protein Tco_1067942 [Tanacetum coccineum]|uniref:Uncharacterized protein n=1 Tax=Tanacetum coccineum TaxID=301880 RepID=A0ABQ5HEB5_9ASTR
MAIILLSSSEAPLFPSLEYTPTYIDAYSYAGGWSRVNTPRRVNGVMSYFQLGDEGAATTSKVVEAEPHSCSQLRSRRRHFRRNQS